jgi:hypothetical protein
VVRLEAGMRSSWRLTTYLPEQEVKYTEKIIKFEVKPHGALGFHGDQWSLETPPKKKVVVGTFSRKCGRNAAVGKLPTFEWATANDLKRTANVCSTVPSVFALCPRWVHKEVERQKITMKTSIWILNVVHAEMSQSLSIEITLDTILPK